jgi:hypothetical protein
MTTTLNADLAGVGADTSMTLAASHAERVSEGWIAEAESLFRMYAQMHPQGFLTEEVRVWAGKLGFSEPPDNRAWGYVARRVAASKYVRAAGFEKQKSANCHGSPKTVWELASNEEYS